MIVYIALLSYIITFFYIYNSRHWNHWNNYLLPGSWLWALVERYKRIYWCFYGVRIDKWDIYFWTEWWMRGLATWQIGSSSSYLFPLVIGIEDLLWKCLVFLYFYYLSFLCVSRQIYDLWDWKFSFLRKLVHEIFRLMEGMTICSQ